jgi:glutathione synthase/RimK-type ligase-like ATP-grasp enzyme
MLLIVTSKDDSHADVLIDRMNSSDRSGDVVRLNTEDFPRNGSFSIGQDSFRLTLKDSGRSVGSDQISTVWYRRPKELELAAEDAYGDFAKSQLNSALRAIYFMTHDTAKWVNPLPALHRARIKLQQLQLARRLGLRPPDSLATNEPEEAIRFCTGRRVCIKSLDQPFGRIGDTIKSLFTAEVSRPQIEKSSAAIAESSVYLQELIEKKLDIRVVIFGKSVHAFEIHSQENRHSQIDFRGISPDRLRHEEHALPSSVEQLLFRFMREQGLIYSSFDLVLDVFGEYRFIENNPNGQWLWLQDFATTDLAAEFIAFLLSDHQPSRVDVSESGVKHL